MRTDGPWKRRTLPPTTCDQCERDYANEPELCVRVLVGDPLADALRGQTICIRCVNELSITGYRRLKWHGTSLVIQHVLGTEVRPKGSASAKPTAQEILKALSSGGFLVQARTRPEPVEFDAELARLAELLEVDD
jgi:hypothetical protein